MIPLLLAVLAAQPAPSAPAIPPPGPAAGGSARAGEIVEEVVAVVRNPAGSPPRLVTRTKLVEEARIALVSRGAVEAAVRPLDAPALAAALQWLLDETLVADEAARLRLDDLDRDSVDREVARFAARFPAPAEYRAFLARAELPEEELAVTLARGLKVRRYLESRVGRAARVTEAEVDRALAARGAAGASPAVREAVRGELAEAGARGQVAALVAELRARADIRILREPGT